MTILSILPIFPILIVLIWPWLPIKQKPRWIDFLPATSAALVLVDLIADGFQVVLVGVYAFSLILFLVTLGRLRRFSPSQPAHRFWAVAGGVLGVIALGLCLVPAILLPFNYRAPTPSGPHAVGTVTFGWEDPSRPETYTPDPADHRKIAVQFWYPVDARPAATKGGKVLPNAALSTSQAKYPVVVFSHGAMGLRASNTATYLELASRGYIVASIDHTYESLMTRFPNGTTVLVSQSYLKDLQRNQSGQMSIAEDLQVTRAWLDLHVGDMRFTLDKIEALNAGQDPSPLAGHIDLDKIGLFGHSLGGATSAALCRQDARCKSTIVIDSTMFGEYDRSTLDGTLVKDPYPKPLMILYNGDTFHATPEHLGYVPDVYAFEHAAAPAYSVVVNGSQHLNFTDLPARFPVLSRLIGQSMALNGGTAGKISPTRCIDILDQYVVAFFDQTLRGAPSQLLAETPRFPEVEFTIHSAQ
jgi:dienelactone hydrolase